MKSKKAVIVDKLKLEFQEETIDEKKAADDEIIIKNMYSVISAGTELSNYTALDKGVRKKGNWNAYPWVPGYGAVGEVLNTGKNNKGLKKGDRIFYIGKHASVERYNRDFWVNVPEDIGLVEIGASVKLKLWAFPDQVLHATVTEIAPVAYERSRGRVEQRTLSERELLYERASPLREQGKVVRVLTELLNENNRLKTDMTGYAKIESGRTTVAGAFFRWLIRFFRVEVWSWIP